MTQTTVCASKTQSVLISKRFVVMMEPFNLLIYDVEKDRMYLISTDIDMIKIMPVTNDVLIMVHLDYIRRILNEHDMKCIETTDELVIIPKIVQNIDELIHDLKLFMMMPIRSRS